MKKIEAIIKEIKMQDVIGALFQIDGLTGLTHFRVHGLGRSRILGEKHITGYDVSHIEHVKVELFCNDNLEELVVQTIIDSAHTGLRGDGKIYVSKIEQAYRIETQESGMGAI